MAIKDKHLATLYSRTGFNAVSRANEIFTQLITLPEIERIKAARDLPHVFTEAVIIYRGDAASESAARDRLKSHFYVNSILKMDRAFHPIRRARTWIIDRITLNLPRKLYIPIKYTFEGDSSPVEARSLPSEIEVMLKTILAAHAPTAAKEKSTLHAVLL